MPKFLRSTDSDFKKKLQSALHVEEDDRSDVVANQVSDILRNVKQRGDEAILEYTNKWDKANFKTASHFLLKDVSACSTGAMKALELAAKRIRDYHERQLPKDHLYTDDTGTQLGWKWTPIDRVGLYVPGGKAAYPSSVLMNAIPAIVAGVKELVMVVPTPNGEVSAAVIAAAKIAGISEIYAIGGAQAVAGLAYGTASIRKVDKIVGPGNAYVAEAKRQVFGQVGIDMIAGPSEILVIADDSANPKWIAADLLSQAEHDENARSVLVTDNEALAKAVENEVDAILQTLSRKAIAEISWRNNGLVILSNNMDEAAEIANLIAPEHLELMTKNPEALAQKIIHAGAIFMGHYTPEAIGDYVAGPSHVLPTSSTARFSSGLSVYDFLKRSSIINCSEKSYRAIAPAASRLAEEEGLTAHKLSVDLR
jgi:histidinol dehydrogenase